MTLNIGWQMQKVAVGWEIYERTGSAFYLGFAGLAQYLPMVAFTLIAGHVTDSYNRKRVLMSALGGPPPGLLSFFMVVCSHSAPRAHLRCPRAMLFFPALFRSRGSVMLRRGARARLKSQR
jgi:MFS family permease